MVAKLPKRSGLHDEIKAKFWAALDEASDPADAERRLRTLVAELERPYPSAAACLTEDLPALCIHLNYFPRLRKRFRSSNLLERSLEEVKRRTKVIGRFPGETSCLSMCWAVRRLGQELPKIPSHPELYAGVIALGGGLTREIVREVFEPMPVGALPPPHKPFNCAHSERFEALFKSLVEKGISHDPEVAGQRFLESLTQEDRANCRYHRDNWKVIADESVRILEQVGQADTEDYVAAARRAPLAKRDSEGLQSLFRQPIQVADRGFINGQHRSCAIRFSGAARVAVVVGEVVVGEEPDVWIYKGGG